MAVSRPSEIKKFIDKGAEVRSDAKEKQSSLITLMAPKVLIESVDGIRKERYGISRTAWILEAIQEKLKKDSN